MEAGAGSDAVGSTLGCRVAALERTAVTVGVAGPSPILSLEACGDVVAETVTVAVVLGEPDCDGGGAVDGVAEDEGDGSGDLSVVCSVSRSAGWRSTSQNPPPKNARKSGEALLFAKC